MRFDNPHNREEHRLCGFFHGGTVNIRVVTEWFRKRSKTYFRPKKRHTQDSDMPPIGKQCASINPQEKIVRPKGDKNPSCTRNCSHACEELHKRFAYVQYF